MTDINPVYDFSRPADVARFLQSLLNRDQQRGWWCKFRDEKGPEFMERVRESLDTRTL